jgi:hypothetical protein
MVRFDSNIHLHLPCIGLRTDTYICTFGGGWQVETAKPPCFSCRIVLFSLEELQRCEIMSKDFEDKPKETSEQKAKRQWSNHDLRRRFLEEKRRPPPVTKINPDMADVLVTTGRTKVEETTKFERKFIKNLGPCLTNTKGATWPFIAFPSWLGSEGFNWRC